MRVCIVGYGRMGHGIEEVLLDRGHTIVSTVDPVAQPSPTSNAAHFGSVTPESLHDVDVAIEFSLPAGVIPNIRQYAAAGVAAVVGTTGWLDKLADVEALYSKAGSAAVYGSNFSIGAHIFFQLATYAASIVSEIEEYDLLIHEIHHRLKKDSPSGTALTLAERVLAAVPRKTAIQTGRLDRAPESQELHVSSSRVGFVPGIHSLYLDSQADSIELTHRARNRGGFALGAVLAAEWVIGKRGLFTVDDFVSQLLVQEPQSKEG